MKMKQAGRGITLLALAAALGVAVYLNWSFSRQAPEVAAEQDVTETAAQPQEDDAAPVQAEADETAVPVYDPLTVQESTDSQAADKNYGEAQLVSVSKDTGTEFFESARLTREKSRDEALDTIQKTLKNASLSEEEKDQATRQLQTQVQNLEQEAELETMIKAKGFVDCVVMLDGSGANVTVMTENDALTADEVTQIRDIILSRCDGIKAQDITVVEVK